MARPSSQMIYYRKAFDNAKRCLREAREQTHPYEKKIMSLKNPTSGNKEDVMSIDFAVEWCVLHHLPTWSQGTWRMHRCGYRLLLERLAKAGRLSEERLALLLDKMLTSRGLNKAERVKKTSSRRKKVVTPEHIDQIEVLTKEFSAKWGEALVIWLRAAVVTGLRPNEWQSAELRDEGGRLILKTENFKHNEHRSYDTHREIDLSTIPEGVVVFVEKQVNIVKGMLDEGMMDAYYQGCSSLLYWCNKKIWPRRKANITLYTGRHQFSANAKADGTVSDVERAAMMGHKTTRTSTERYGRAKSGSRGLTPGIADKSVLSKIQDPGVKRAPQNGPKNTRDG
jgi:integrase